MAGGVCVALGARGLGCAHLRICFQMLVHFFDRRRLSEWLRMAPVCSLRQSGDCRFIVVWGWGWGGWGRESLLCWFIIGSSFLLIFVFFLVIFLRQINEEMGKNAFYKELILLFHERDGPYHSDDFFYAGLNDNR